MNSKKEIFDFFIERRHQPIERTLNDLLDNYDIIKKPQKSCYECGHYKKIKPGEITFVGKTFPNIESCSLGHTIGRYIADNCKDHWKI